MKEQIIESRIQECQLEELTAEEQRMVQIAIEGTKRSYTPYSHFHVGASVLLNNGEEFIGCNQENAAFPAGLCAERTALFAAGAEYPDEPVKILAIAARGTDGQLTDEPVSPCGTCRQVIIETETRHRQPVVILLYGRRCVYRMEGIRQLMPLSFTEF
ncbi:MAG: cytidine deaminase [Prevotella sp.]|jgi:cytidine deaminase|nr:cytidine deaminase [Prevotella sp.]